MLIREYRADNFSDVKTLWEEAFPNDPPWNRAEVAIPAKLAAQPDLLFVAVREGMVTGTIMAGYDGHRGWLYALAVRVDARGSGIGSALVRHAEGALRALGCGKVNLQVRASSEGLVPFYARLGFEVEDRISLGKHL